MTGQPDAVNRFHAALRDEDWNGLGAVLTDDVHWIMPGDNLISGVARGREAVVGRARQVAAYNMRFDVRGILVSVDGVALLQHNTADSDGHHYDQLVATVCSVRDDLICQIQTFVSDLAAFDSFFINAP